MSAVVVTGAGGAVEVERLVRESGVRWTILRPRAFAALLDDGHHAGPETITRTDRLRVLSEVTGLPARREETAPEDLSRHRPDVAAQRSIGGTAAVEEVTGVPPRTFTAWAEEHVGEFRTPGPVMRAARIHAYGDPSVISIDEVPTPRPGPGEVLVEVAATSFNPSEAGLRAGLLRDVLPLRLPHTLGWDVSGTVVETGEGVTGLAPGDRVAGWTDGTAASYVVAPATVLVRAPESVPLADAAAVPVAGLTAWQAVHEQAGIGPGQRVLVNGAGGGVGLFAVQLAKLAGAHVTATASARSTEAVRRLGADAVVDYTEGPPPGGMDVLLNLAALPDEQAAALAGTAGKAVTIASPIEGAAHFVMRNDPVQLAALVELIDKGDLVIEIAESHPLSVLADLHRRAEAGQTRGKITLHP